MTSLYLVTPFYKEVCVLSNVRDYYKVIISPKVQFKVTPKVTFCKSFWQFGASKVPICMFRNKVFKKHGMSTFHRCQHFQFHIQHRHAKMLLNGKTPYNH